MAPERPPASALANIHASAVVVGDRGVLIAGPSGSGKSRLALALVAAMRERGRFARLVADDRVLIEAVSGRLAASAPAAIAGLVEVRGFGPLRVATEPAALVDLLVRLVPAAQAPRLPEPASELLEGCEVPSLSLAQRDCAGAVPVIFAALGPDAYMGAYV